MKQIWCTNDCPTCGGSMSDKECNEMVGETIWILPMLLLILIGIIIFSII